MQSNQLTRVFRYGGTTFPDPDPSSPPDAVRHLLSQGYPDLATAVVGAPKVEGGNLVYELERAVGTKG